MDHKKLAESFKNAIDICCIKKAKNLESDTEFIFTLNSKKVFLVYKKGTIVPDISDELMQKWVKINYMINQEFEKNKEEIIKELEKVGL